MQTLKQFVLVAAVLATMIGRTKAFDFGTLRGHLEEGQRDDSAQRMSVAASKESARHLLRKWLLRSEEKQPEVVVKQEAHEEAPKAVVAQPEERKTLETENPRKNWLFRRSPSIIPLSNDYVRPGRKLAELVTGISQIFFVPLEEDQLIFTFVALSDGVGTNANGTLLEARCNDTDCTDVNTFVSVTISYDDTIVIWDHWEDGYEDLEGAAEQPSTEIWGDENCSNGHRPDVDCMNDEDDVLNAGDAVVINNIVELPRNKSDFRFDGRDMILASDPVAVVRGGFAVSTGPLLAGAVEVYDTLKWGREFISPVGEDTVNASLRLDPFRTTSLYVMARENGTMITYSNSTATDVTATINKGDSFVINGVNQGDTISSTKDIQVHILTGENGFPWYELRWYSLLDVFNWSNDYYSPVGVSDGGKNTRIWVFNPSNTTLEVTIQTLSNTTTLSVPANEAARSPFNIPSGSGARVFSGSDERIDGQLVANGTNFFAFTQTDIENIGTNTFLSGQSEDWGHPLIAAKNLTAQAIVGVGWGCPEQRTNGSELCGSFSDLGVPVPVTEVVWISPLENATCFVDYFGTGSNISDSFDLMRLESKNITDNDDNDLSGALIWCVVQGDEPTGDGVLVALAYGQDPTRTEGVFGSDVGYVIFGAPSLQPMKTWKLVGNLNPGDGEEVNKGDTLEYTLKVVNQAQSPFPVSRLSICDTLPGEVNYTFGVNGTCWEIVNGNGTVMEDDCLSEADEMKLFNGTCWSNTEFKGSLSIPTRPGALIITFNVTVTGVPDGDDNDLRCGDIVNTAKFTYTDGRATISDNITAETPTCNVCINNMEGNATDDGCTADTPLCQAAVNQTGDECRKCQVTDSDIDINCNETTPICDDPDGDGYGDFCSPRPTTTTTPEVPATTTTPEVLATTTTPEVLATTTTPDVVTTGTPVIIPTQTTPTPPTKPPCDPTLCQACWYFCGTPAEDGYTCSPKHNFMSFAPAPAYMYSCRVHPFCNMCGVMCPDIGEGEHCPAGACPTDENEQCD